MNEVATFLPGFAYDNLTTSRIGVQGNTLYDVISDNDGTGYASVSAATLTIDCSPFPLATPVPVYSDLPQYYPWQGVWSVNGTQGQQVFFNPTDMGLVRIPTMDWEGVEQSDSGPVMPILFGASLRDSNGATIDDYFPMYYPTGMVTNAGNGTLEAQICSCNLAVTRSTVDVDLQSKLVVSPVARRNSSIWVYTQEPIADDPIRDWFYSLWSFGGPGNSLASVSCFESANCTYLSEVEQYLAQVLGLHSGLQYPNSTQDVSLISLEQAMEDALSLLIWSVSMLSSEFKGNTTETVGHVQVLQARLNLNMISAIAGTAVSVVLLCLSMALTWKTAGQRDRPQHMFDSIGVLQITWLSGQFPTTPDRLADEVERPSTTDLRRAGALLPLLPSDVELEKVDLGTDSGHVWNA
ncbi:hypothetical protein CALCODRAFT_493585 [Calocera cornea HHB12733]|uniref:Uncharacterized protein n=1 Tax=Calocera cornea HHB12733 TaxID=1353952 RepID=A0A165HL95_9BASI|nr:hypothetical protein CALCODRAFT_493585 [Calocera cornea HHB12733]